MSTINDTNISDMNIPNVGYLADLMEAIQISDDIDIDIDTDDTDDTDNTDNTDEIIFMDTKEEALSSITILIHGIMAEGSSHYCYEDAVILLPIINDIYAGKIDKVSMYIDNILLSFQNNEEYEMYVRVFRKYYSNIITNDIECISVFKRVLKFIEQNQELKNKYLDSIKSAIDFFSENISEFNNAYLIDLMGLSILNIPMETEELKILNHDYFDAIDYFTLSLEL